jgi:hypothetical protein
VRIIQRFQPDPGDNILEYLYRISCVFLFDETESPNKRSPGIKWKEPEKYGLEAVAAVEGVRRRLDVGATTTKS